MTHIAFSTTDGTQDETSDALALFRQAGAFAIATARLTARLAKALGCQIAAIQNLFSSTFGSAFGPMQSARHRDYRLPENW